MSLLSSLTFVLLIFMVVYYFIIAENLNYDRLFTIILNFLLLIILPLYYLYFKDPFYSLIISIFLFLSAFFLNIKIKEIFHKVKILPFIYFLLTSIIVSTMIYLI